MTGQATKKLKLPDAPGVYTFRDVRGRPLYIGRATSLRDRVKSYFTDDLIETRGPRIVDMITRAARLTYEKTDSVLEAIILESALIKRYQPHYNVGERDDKSSQYIVITDESWPRVFLARARDVDNRGDTSRGVTSIGYKIKRHFGPYPYGGLIKEVLKILRRLFPFKDKKSFDARHDAFYRAIGRSPRENDGNARRRYIRTIHNLILFFEGRKDLIRKKLEREMRDAAKELRFEDAHEAKKLLYALDHINDIALIKRNSAFVSADGPIKRRFRIEAYDVAHLSGTNVVGAMTVSVNGEAAPSEYRRFKISRQANDDIAGLKEILTRRLNHSEWQYPDLIVVDGNQAQRSHAEDVLKARRLSIPVVAVTKDEHHRASHTIGHPELAQKYKREIVAVNAEAHRFAIRYHRSKRSILAI